MRENLKQIKFVQSANKTINNFSLKWNKYSIEERNYQIQLGLLTIVQLADTLTTHAVIQTFPHNSIESNPAMRFLIGFGGIAFLGLVKLLAGLVEVKLGERVRKKQTTNLRSLNNILRINNLVFLAGSINNTALLLMK